MATFAVCEVPRGQPYEVLDADSSVSSLLSKRVEAFCIAEECLVSCQTIHPFAKAAHDAFYDHHPLVIRPDDVWFCIAQGFAAHVSRHAEELRSQFVEHEGKRKLVVQRPDFFLGQPNQWSEAFAEFSAQIGQHVGKLRNLVVADFSTTTPIEKAAFEVSLMDTFQGYFEYEMLCGCGIPEITVLGSPADWKSIVERTRHLSEFGLEFWTDALVPILEKIYATAAGNVDTEFWRSFFRYQSGSGPAELTGWLLTLFPYLSNKSNDDVALEPNAYLTNWRKGFLEAESRTSLFPDFRDMKGPAIESIPGGLASAPVHFVDLSTDTAHNLRFIAGMFGVHQRPGTNALAPTFGWAVVHE